MNLANFVEGVHEDFAILSKMAHLLLDRIEGFRCSDILYSRCRIASLSQVVTYHKR